MVIALEAVGLTNFDSSVRPSSLLSTGKKRPWCEDAQNILHLIMGQFNQSTQTLDLLKGASSRSTKVVELECDKPLLKGWERCLDLSSGVVYYVHCITGAKSLDHPCGQLLAGSSVLSLRDTFKVEDDNPTLIPATADSSNNCDILRYRQPQIDVEENVSKPVEGSKRGQDKTTNTAGSITHNSASSSHQSNKMKGGSLHWMSSSETETALDLKLSLPTEEDKADPCAEDRFQHSGTLLPTHLLDKKIPYTPSLETPPASASPVPSSEAADLVTRPGALAAPRDTECTDTSLVAGGCRRCLMYVLLSKADPTCYKCGSSVLLDFNSAKRLKSSLPE